MELCVFCGAPLVEGKCEKEHAIKKMCVNCKFSQKDDDGNYICANEENLNTVKTKMIEAAKLVSEGYEVKEFTIAPLPLKKPTAKCESWTLNEALLEQLFV